MSIRWRVCAAIVGALSLFAVATMGTASIAAYIGVPAVLLCLAVAAYTGPVSAHSVGPMKTPTSAPLDRAISEVIGDRTRLTPDEYADTLAAYQDEIWTLAASYGHK